MRNKESSDQVELYKAREFSDLGREREGRERENGATRGMAKTRRSFFVSSWTRNSDMPSSLLNRTIYPSRPFPCSSSTFCLSDFIKTRPAGSPENVEQRVSEKKTSLPHQRPTPTTSPTMSFLPTPPSELASRHENGPKAKDATVWIPSTWDEGVSSTPFFLPSFSVPCPSSSDFLFRSQATKHAQAIFGRVILRDEIPEAESLAVCDGIGSLRERERRGKRADPLPSLLSTVLRPYALTRERLLAAPRLRAIARNGVGYDSIDAEAAAELNIAVMNVPGESSSFPSFCSFVVLAIHLLADTWAPDWFDGLREELRSRR